jgi:hypothetical protein
MRRSKRLNAMLKAITPCIDDDDVLIDDVVIPFAPTRTVLVRARVRHVGPLKPADAPIEVHDDALGTE